MKILLRSAGLWGQAAQDLSEEKLQLVETAPELTELRLDLPDLDFELVDFHSHEIHLEVHNELVIRLAGM